MNLDKEQLPVVHVGVCEDYPRLRDKNPLLIGRTESMPLCKRNRLHVWTYYLSNDANGDHRSQLPPTTVPPSSERGPLLKDVGGEEAGAVNVRCHGTASRHGALQGTAAVGLGEDPRAPPV